MLFLGLQAYSEGQGDIGMMEKNMEPTVTTMRFGGCLNSILRDER